MRKRAFYAAGITAAFGLAGYFLRARELAALYTDGTGLAAVNAPETVLLLACAAVFAVFAALFSAARIPRAAGAVSYAGAFGLKRPAGLVPYVLCALAVVGAAFLLLRHGVTVSATVDMCLCLFAALSGGAIALAAWCAYTGKRGGLALMSVIPAVFLCFWLVLIYKENDTDPQLIEYVYMCLAPAALAVSFYYTAGYAYGKAAPRKLVFAHMLAVFFTGATLADGWGRTEKMLLLALGCTALMNLYVFVRNLGAPAARRTAPPEDPAAAQ